MNNGQGKQRYDRPLPPPDIQAKLELCAMNDKNGASLAYGLNMLRLLLSMKLITEEEYNNIVQLQAEHYDPQKKLCLFL